LVAILEKLWEETETTVPLMVRMSKAEALPFARSGWIERA
jgi:hypothetical protein